MVYKWIKNLINAVPHLCVFCHATLRTEADICQDCLDSLAYNLLACPRCAEPQENRLLCGRCLTTPPAIGQVIAPLLYASPVDHLLHRFKYRSQPGLARTLARLLSAQLKQQDIVMPDCIIPVPLHRFRQSFRGYNQAHELSTAVARDLELPIDNRSCSRNRPTAAQRSLHKRERQANLAKAFSVKLSEQWDHVVLVDDIYTTGETINSLARELLSQGVGRVDAWVIARTAEHH